MGTVYEYTTVHGRVLVWWTANDGTKHERWLEGADAEAIADFEEQTWNRMQIALMQLVTKPTVPFVSPGDLGPVDASLEVW